jgi:hypothetical protein
MRRALLLPLLIPVATGLACSPDESTGPGGPAASPPAEQAVMAIQAAVVGIATVDDPGDVGTSTSLVSTAGGVQHITYRDDSNQRLKYAICQADCTMALNWNQAVIDQSANVGLSSSLKVRSGVRHVVYLDATNQRLKYATCSAGCLSEGNWSKGAIERGLAKGYSSLTLDTDGRRYVSYVALTGAVKYATCAAACTSSGNWQTVTIDPDAVGQVTSIAVGADGRRHISYGSDGDLKYATCAVSCTNAANWQTLKIDEEVNSGQFNAIAVGADGVRHISYYDGSNQDLRYARCSANCTNSAGWNRVTVDRGTGRLGSNVGLSTSLAVGGNGRVHVSYYDATAGNLKYATCAVGCLQTSSWQRQALDTDGDVGSYTSLALAGGTVHISYHHRTLGDLKYLELTP